MRYLVKARVKPGQETALRQAIADGTLGQGSIAGDEYVYDLEQARVGKDGVAHWVETCFCATPLEEERPYWEKYFELLSVKDAHNRKNCRHENGSEPWACSNCDCTKRLEEKLQQQGESFLKSLGDAFKREKQATNVAVVCSRTHSCQTGLPEIR
jgi:hypothetical protein